MMIPVRVLKSFCPDDRSLHEKRLANPFNGIIENVQIAEGSQWQRLTNPRTSNSKVLRNPTILLEESRAKTLADQGFVEILSDPLPESSAPIADDAAPSQVLPEMVAEQLGAAWAQTDPSSASDAGPKSKASPKRAGAKNS